MTTEIPVFPVHVLEKSACTSKGRELVVCSWAARVSLSFLRAVPKEREGLFYYRSSPPPPSLDLGDPLLHSFVKEDGNWQKITTPMSEERDPSLGNAMTKGSPREL